MGLFLKNILVFCFAFTVIAVTEIHHLQTFQLSNFPGSWDTASWQTDLVIESRFNFLLFGYFFIWGRNPKNKWTIYNLFLVTLKFFKCYHQTNDLDFWTQPFPASALVPCDWLLV